MKFLVVLCVCVALAVAKDVKGSDSPKENGKGDAAAAAATATKESVGSKGLNDATRESRGLKDSLSSISAALKGFNQINSLMNTVNVTEIGDASTRVAKELSKSLKLDVFAVGKALAGAGAAVGTTVFLGGMAALLATGLGFFNYSPRLYDSGYPFVQPAVYQNRVGPHYPGVLGQAQQAVYQRVQQAQAAYSAASVGHSRGLPTGQSQLPVVAGDKQTPHQPLQYPVYHGAAHQGGRAEFGEVSARTARVLDEVKQPANPDLMPAIQDLISKLGEVANVVGPQVMAAARR